MLFGQKVIGDLPGSAGGHALVSLFESHFPGAQIVLADHHAISREVGPKFVDPQLLGRKSVPTIPEAAPDMIRGGEGAIHLSEAKSGGAGQIQGDVGGAHLRGAVNDLREGSLPIPLVLLGKPQFLKVRPFQAQHVGEVLNHPGQQEFAEACGEGGDPDLALGPGYEVDAPILAPPPGVGDDQPGDGVGPRPVADMQFIRQGRVVLGNLPQ